MKRPSKPRRRPVVHITLERASRLHRLLTILGGAPEPRESLLERLSVGLRTFYRELELLKRCGIKVRREGKGYRLHSSMVEAEGLLPFPDPQLSFAEMAELTRHPGEAASRLAEIYRKVVTPPEPKPKKKRPPRKK